MSDRYPSARFNPGIILMTYSVAAQASIDDAFTDFVVSCVARHLRGDWGILCDDDKQMNDEALVSQDRILSYYKHDERKIYIITEASRSYTTVMFADEY